MAIVINGSGTVTGLAVGGLPDATVDAGTVAADVATQSELDTVSTVASAAVPKAGGTLTGNLTVGTTSVADPILLIQSSGSGDPQLNLSSAAANRSGKIRFLDNGSAVGGFINYLHNGDKMEFGSGSSTTVGFRVADGYSNAAQGLTFGSDTAAANKLDDYEEGTFTMAVQDWSDATFSIASVTAAKYTKVGNAVTIWFRGSLVSSTSNPSEGDIKFTGWPFSTAGGVQIYVDFIAANLGTNQTNMRLSFYGSGAYLYCLNSSGNLTSMSASLPGTTEFGLSFTYMVA